MSCVFIDPNLRLHQYLWCLERKKGVGTHSRAMIKDFTFVLRSGFTRRVSNIALHGGIQKLILFHVYMPKTSCDIYLRCMFHVHTERCSQCEEPNRHEMRPMWRERHTLGVMERGPLRVFFLYPFHILSLSLEEVFDLLGITSLMKVVWLPFWFRTGEEEHGVDAKFWWWL